MFTFYNSTFHDEALLDSITAALTDKCLDPSKPKEHQIHINSHFEPVLYVGSDQNTEAILTDPKSQITWNKSIYLNYNPC